jgi:serine O-acetyltransferase
MPSDWKSDRELYPKDAWLTEPSLWAVAVYRYGRWGRGRRTHERVHRLLHLTMRVLTGIELPSTVEIGPGLRIYHQGAITFNAGVKVGARCRIRQGVTIGVRERDGDVPTIGDDVFIGSFAQILGAVSVGDGANIGAGAVVLSDVPAGATAVGVPARVISR